MYSYGQPGINGSLFGTSNTMTNPTAITPMVPQNQTNVLAQKIDQLGYQLDQCCCSIKTQMLQDRLADAKAANVALQGTISNANQSQYLLGQLGRFVAWTPSGTQTGAAG